MSWEQGSHLDMRFGCKTPNTENRGDQITFTTPQNALRIDCLDATPDPSLGSGEMFPLH